MPHHDKAEISGRITDIFAHRFVVETTSGTKILADLGPKGAQAFPLTTGTEIVVAGEMKPSELKVTRIARKGESAVSIEHKPKPHHGPDGDPKVAIGAVRTAGFEPLGEPRRKPKHFEVLARSGDAFVECHVELDGQIRKEKPVAPHDEKWAADIRRAA